MWDDSHEVSSLNLSKKESCCLLQFSLVLQGLIDVTIYLPDVNDSIKFDLARIE